MIEKIEKNIFKTFVKLLKNAKAYIKALIIAVIGIILTRASEGAIYKFLVPKTLDSGLIAKDPQFLEHMPITILGIFCCLGLGEFLSKFMMGHIGRGIVRDYRIRMLGHLLEVPLSYYKEHTSGMLLSKINYDAEQVAVAVSDAIREFLSSIIAISLLIGVMLSISWQITLGCIIIAPLIIGYLQLSGKLMRRYSTRVQKSMGHLTHVASEVINNYPIIRIYQGINYELNRAKTAANNNYKQELKVFFISAISSPIMHILSSSILIGFVSLVKLELVPLTIGKIFGVIGAMFALIRPLKQITEVNNVFQKGIAAAESIHELLDSPKEQDLGNKIIKKVKGQITFNNISFAYLANQPVLSNISFDIAAGKTVALVGCSGSGKSTLVSLLLRFFEPTNGKILLDGINIKELALTNLRDQFSMVTQQVMLFNDTIANNIAYGRSKGPVSREEIIQAAKDAYALEFIEKLPYGFDTYIGENGNLLSGGQRQRLAIARAILKNAPILILDEATSSIDPEAEKNIQLAVERLMQNKTTFIIAHKLPIIEHADKILVLDAGRIVEQGNHHSLLSEKGRYARMSAI